MKPWGWADPSEWPNSPSISGAVNSNAVSVIDTATDTVVGTSYGGE